MSDEKKPLTIIEPEKMASDFSDYHLRRIQQYIDAGLPNIAQVTQDTKLKMADLYLSGKSYSQISMITKTDKDIVMYLSHKQNWCQIKHDYFKELDENMGQRLLESKLMSQESLLKLQHFFQKKIGKTIDRYLATDNEDIANEINLKDVAAYIKTLETLGKTISDFRGEPKSPTIGLNMGEGGVTMTKNQDGTIDITPKQKAVGAMLKELADARRADEKK